MQTHHDLLLADHDRASMNREAAQHCTAAAAACQGQIRVLSLARRVRSQNEAGVVPGHVLCYIHTV